MASESLQAQVKKLLRNPDAVRKLKTANGKSVEDILKSEAQRLRRLVQNEIENIYSTQSNWYERTGKFKQALDENIVYDRATNSITIGFDREMASHDSYFGDHGKKSFVPLAMNDGFKLLFTDRRFEGTHYMEKAIEKYNRDKPKWIKVRLLKSSERDDYYYDEYL